MDNDTCAVTAVDFERINSRRATSLQRRRNRSDSLEDVQPFLTSSSYQRQDKPAEYGQTESHQYEEQESEVWWHHQLQRHYEDRGRWWTFARKTDMLRWILTFVTGVCCGLVAIFVTSCTKVLTTFKYDTFYALLLREKNNELPFGSGYAFLLSVNLVFGFIGWCMVVLEPLANGSGIPEVKCFLNGLNIPRLVRMRTLWAKIIGIVFAVSAGLPAGKEGPMVHAGAVVAAGISQGKTVTFGLDTTFSKYQDFRNDREKRDFVACGAAAGVGAAFNAPIGGVLFSLEEGASFWSTRLTWRAFFCAMTTVTTLFFFSTAGDLFGHSGSSRMFSFGQFFSLKNEESNFSVWELSLFMVLGCMGGLVGAVFNNIQLRLYHWRSKHVTSKFTQLLQVFAIITAMTSVAFGIPLLWHSCTPLPVNMDGWNDQEKDLVPELVSLYCDEETEYNELASLFLTHPDIAIRQLFHYREEGNQNANTFSSSALFMFFVPYFIMAVLTFGTIPAGLFVPSLTSGAAFGRLVGHLLHKLDNASGTFADSGTYALMGAAAVTGGITRMTISLTVIILEATGDMQYVLPLMLTVMAARWVGNTFNDGIYDEHIQSHMLPYLDEDEGVSRLRELHDLTVSDIMTKRPYCMLPVMRVGEVYEILKLEKHHYYPVVDSDESNTLTGSILRKTICTLLKHKAFGPAGCDPNSEERISPLVAWGTLECIYPRYPDIEQLSLTEKDRMDWLDIRPYIDSATITLNEHASVQRAYRMFRTLGMRHMCIVNRHNQVLGVVTRSDLASAHHMQDSGGTATSSGSSSSSNVSGTSNSSRRRQRKKQNKHEYLHHTIDLDLDASSPL